MTGYYSHKAVEDLAPPPTGPAPGARQAGEIGTLLVEHDGPNLGECNYYQGVGTCTFGCWEEPACHTDGPWPEPDWHPMKRANMRGRRLAYRTSNWLSWVRMAMWIWEREHPSERFMWKGEHDLDHLRRPAQIGSSAVTGSGAVPAGAQGAVADGEAPNSVHSEGDTA